MAADWMCVCSLACLRRKCLLSDHMRATSCSNGTTPGSAKTPRKRPQNTGASSLGEKKKVAERGSGATLCPRSYWPLKNVFILH